MKTPDPDETNVLIRLAIVEAWLNGRINATLETDCSRAGCLILMQNAIWECKRAISREGKDLHKCKPIGGG